MYIFVDNKKFEMLAIDSPFLTFTVDFSSNLSTSSLSLRTPEILSLLSKSSIAVFNTHLALCLKDDTITFTQSHRQVAIIIKSKLTSELALELRALPLPLADQKTSRIVAELGKK